MQKIIQKYLDRLHESLNRSALLSAFPPKKSSSRLDLHRLSCLDEDLPTQILELLIYSQNASIPLQFKYDELTELSLEIERLKENQEPVPEELIQKMKNLQQIGVLHAIFAKKLTRESELIYRETGLRSLWLGYPLAYLTVPSSAKKPKRILAPIFLWPIKIKANLAKQGEVLISRDEDSGTPIYNKAFDLWCTKYLGVNPDDPHHDALVEISKNDMKHLIDEIFKGFNNPPRLVDEYGIKPIPARDTLNQEGVNQKVLNSAILGVIKWENQAVMSNLEELIQLKGYPKVVTGILGGEFTEEDTIDKQDLKKVDEFSRYNICKTDHWQQTAIQRARLKPGIVVHGPPGTGKSETIVNIVADCLARDERVLVVCQKRAAIDVVYDRIKEGGLDSLCALVHDSNTNRKRVIESLKEQIEEVQNSSNANSSVSDKRQTFSIEIDDIERILDDYAKALYAQEDSLKISYREARSLYLKIREQCKGLRENKALCGKLIGVNDINLKKLTYKVRHIGKLFYEAEPKNNPWKWRKRDFAVSRHLKDDVFGMVEKVITEINNFKPPDPFNNPVSEIPKNKVEYQEKLKDIVELLNSTVSRSNIELLGEWISIKDTEYLYQEVQLLSSKIKEISLEDINIELHRHFYSAPRGEFELLERLAFKCLNKHAGIMKIFNFGSKKAERSLKDKFNSLKLDLDKFDNDVLHRYFNVVLKWLDIREYIKKSKLSSFIQVSEITTSTLKKDYETINLIVQSYSDWKTIKPLVYEPVVKNVLYSLSSNDYINFKSKLDEYILLTSNIENIFKILESIEKLNEWFTDEVIDSCKLEIWKGNYSTKELSCFLDYYEKLQPLIQFEREFANLSSLEKGIINTVFEELTNEGVINYNLNNIDVFSETCVSFVEVCAFYNSIASYENKYPVLTSYSAKMYEKDLNRLKDLLNEKHGLESKAICNIWSQKQGYQMESSVWDSILVVKGRRSKRLRQVIDLGTSNGLFDLKPCWITNPNTACQIFPLTEEYFDTVIFDEASQCPIEQAIPLIYRAKKIIVSGDEKQLPPTSFFKSGFETEDEDEEEKPEDEMTSGEVTQRNIERARQEQIASTESLLDASKTFLKDVSLNTHYRSLHPSLIAFSNHAFYNKRLAAPPLNCHQYYLNEPPIVYKQIDGVYKDRQNRDEAKYVIALVKQIWKETPRPSIGIVTFNLQQRDLILDELVNECEGNREFEAIYAAERERKDGNQENGFFVKNLESVQGDERDVMIFSTTYGRNEDGKFLRIFGPINRDGGEKRLNVVITRSKKRMYIMTSMPIEQISDVIAKGGINPGANIRGAEYLHLFMHYARATSQGDREDQERYLNAAGSLTRISGSDTGSNVVDSGFEAEVASALNKRGFIVSHQIGESGFKIDLAIKHRDEKLGYILGIECDGATYHSGFSARMRDIWRQDILESRGWNIHRIWSTDWWDDPQREIERIKRKVDAIYEESESDKQSFKNNEQTNGEPYTNAENPEEECSGETSSVHQEGQSPTSENKIKSHSITPHVNVGINLSPEISLLQENSYSSVCLPMTMKLAVQSRKHLESSLKKLPNSWAFLDKVVVLLYPFFDGDVKNFHSDDGPNMKKVFQENQLESLDRELKRMLEDYLGKLRKETNQDNTFSSELETNTENQIFNEATGNVQGRLDEALEYIEYKKKRRVTKENKTNQVMRKTVIDLLKRSTQGKDLIADNVLRELGFSCRGKERTKLKNKVLRIIKDMKDKGIIEEYRTDTRKRLKLIKQDFNNDQKH